MKYRGRSSEVRTRCVCDSAAKMDVNERMDEAEVDRLAYDTLNETERDSSPSVSRCTCIVVPCTRWTDSSRLNGSWLRLSGWHADSSNVSHFSEISSLFLATKNRHEQRY